jgi:hypothetical protein
MHSFSRRESFFWSFVAFGLGPGHEGLSRDPNKVSHPFVSLGCRPVECIVFPEERASFGVSLHSESPDVPGIVNVPALALQWPPVPHSPAYATPVAKEHYESSLTHLRQCGLLSS